MPFEFPDITKINIDWGAILRWANLPFFALIWRLFINGGWIIFVFLIFWVIAQIITYQAEINKEKDTKYVLLAIDVPKDNLHGPEVTERLFAHLATAGSVKGFGQTHSIFFHSIFFQPRFSFEIISIGGRIQFLVRTPEEFRDLVEAAFYGEYPNAEIYEVEDYTKDAPDKFPNQEYDLWGTEIVLYNKESYPIRTYPSFEHSLSGEFKDPISNFLEVLGRLSEGEELWIQIIITFGRLGWRKTGEKLVSDLIGAKPKEEGGRGIFGLFGSLINKCLWGLVSFYRIAIEETVTEREVPIKKEAPPSLMTFLSPGEKETVAAIQRKISKIGFRTKFRIVYLAKKDVYNVHRAVPGVLGALNQFNTLDMNGFKPDDKVKTYISPLSFHLSPGKYLIKKQNEILRAYKERGFRRGTNGYILNIEELATIYHFPVVTVEAPLIKKTGSKKAEPPFTLPIKEEF